MYVYSVFVFACLMYQNFAINKKMKRR